MARPRAGAPCRRRGRPVAAVELDDDQRRVLERWAGGRTTPTLRARATILLACADGSSNEEAAALVGLSARVAGAWRRRFASEGLWGLLDRPRPGAPVRTDEGLAELGRELGGGASSSSRQLARAGGFSQSSARRLKAVLAAQLAGSELVGLYAQGRDRCLALRVLDTPVAPAAALEADQGCWSALLEADRRVRSLAGLLPPGSGTVRLRRFLKQLERLLERSEQGCANVGLVAVGESFRAHAVQRWLRKHDRYTVHAVATQAWFRRMLKDSLGRTTTRSQQLRVAALAYNHQAGLAAQPQPLVWLPRSPLA